MLGVIRAAAILVCLYMVAATASAQPPVSPRNSYERILVILPIIGSGTAADPMRPSLIPAPGGATPNILNIAISVPSDRWSGSGRDAGGRRANRAAEPHSRLHLGAER
jgi:hypothetical protein